MNNTTMNKNNVPFWGNNPQVILNNEYIVEIYPTPKMSYEQKINAITRFVILLSILGFIFTMSVKFIFIGIITVFIIFIIGNRHISMTRHTEQANVEAFDSGPGSTSGSGSGSGLSSIRLLNPETLQPFLKSEFEITNSKNPLGNVLLTQIYDTPERKSAPPSFNNETYEDITNATKKMIQMLNPGIKNTNKQLFGDLGEKFGLDQSMRSFYSTANTKVCSDQGSFGQYLYGFMPSSKGVSPADNLQREKDAYRYTLY